MGCLVISIIISFAGFMLRDYFIPWFSALFEGTLNATGARLRQPPSIC